jgi:hypothetical protein
MHELRQQLSGVILDQIETEFPYPASGYTPADDTQYFTDPPLELLSSPSTTIIEHVQFTAKKLVENLNVLGRSAVQA